MIMSTSNLLLDQTLQMSVPRPKKQAKIESHATSDIDFGNRSVSPITEKLNQTVKPLKEAGDLVNQAAPSASLQVEKKKTETAKQPSKLASVEIKKPTSDAIKVDAIKSQKIDKKDSKLIEQKAPDVKIPTS